MRVLVAVVVAAFLHGIFLALVYKGGCFSSYQERDGVRKTEETGGKEMMGEIPDVPVLLAPFVHIVV